MAYLFSAWFAAFVFLSVLFTVSTAVNVGQYVIANPRRVLNRWIFTTNHKDISVLYFMFGAASAAIGTSLSFAIRSELAYAGPQFFAGNHQLYNTVVTSHALIMIFFFVMPVLIGGFGNYFIPYLMGVNDMAFPRLNNLSFWLLPHALFLLLLSNYVEEGAGTG